MLVATIINEVISEINAECKTQGLSDQPSVEFGVNGLILEHNSLFGIFVNTTRNSNKTTQVT